MFRSDGEHAQGVGIFDATEAFFLTAILSASAIQQWYLPGIPVAPVACTIIAAFVAVNLCGVKWVARLAIPFADYWRPTAANFGKRT